MEQHVQSSIIYTDAFWALVALIIFVLIMSALKVPSMIVKKLDERAENIASELEEARRLKELAHQYLMECQIKLKEAETHAKEILESAQREARQISNDMRKMNEAYLVHQKEISERKIKMAQTELLNDVKKSSVELALKIAKENLVSISANEQDEIFKKALEDFKKVSF